jgi:hypothetical protein
MTWGGGRYGIARNDKQVREFSDYGKIYLEVYTDRNCTVREKDPKTSKDYVTLKHYSTIKRIGFVD